MNGFLSRVRRLRATRIVTMSAIGMLAVGCKRSVELEDGSGGAIAGTASATDIASSTGSALACPAFADEQSPGTLIIHVHNESSGPLWLPMACSGVVFDVRSEAQSALSYGFEPTCLQTCQERQSSPPLQCDDCAPAVRLLETGEVLDIPWDETGLEGGNGMPSNCYQGAPDASCYRRHAAKPGNYRVTVPVASNCEGDCTCNDQGICNGVPGGFETESIPVSFAVPSSSVDVVLGSCTIPCP